MKANILIVDDDPDLREALGDRLEFWGHRVSMAPDGESALVQCAQQSFDLILMDISMPGMDGLTALKKLKDRGDETPVVMITAHGSLDRAIEAIRNGAEEFLTKPADFDVLKKLVQRVVERTQLVHSNANLQEQTEEDRGFVPGESPAMKSLLDTAARAAASDATILLNGESGCGKQVMAEYIHANSDRRSGAFVYVNCVAISDELIESTLFGHEKGAFTGADSKKIGRLETAGGGTAFLDEIGDISSRLQTKLLHFLDSGEFERVGGNQIIPVDCRIIAATNRDLKAAVDAGEFREDLYYRLNVIRLEIPPLRKRVEDIVPLAEVYVERFGKALKRGPLKLDPETKSALMAYAWPGNVRQLKNAIERMVVLATDKTLTPDLLPPELSGSDGDPAVLTGDLSYKESILSFKRHLVEQALKKTSGNRTQAAENLGLQRTHLSRLIKELGVQES